MEPGKHIELQLSLNKEGMRLKSFPANTHPSRLTESESANETLQYWQNQFGSEIQTILDIRGGAKLLEKVKSGIRIYGFEGINPLESKTYLLSK
jgi:hypothetical protein